MSTLTDDRRQQLEARHRERLRGILQKLRLLDMPLTIEEITAYVRHLAPASMVRDCIHELSQACQVFDVGWKRAWGHRARLWLACPPEHAHNHQCRLPGESYSDV